MEEKVISVKPYGIFKSAVRWTYRWGFPYVHSRLELPYILNARGLAGEGVEIGVQQGDFSEWLLRHWKGKVLYSVDPWREFEKDQYLDTSNLPQSRQEEFFREASGCLARFGERSRILRELSVESAVRFNDRSLDFVYIDAQHHYEAVKEDIGLWAPKIRSGGVLAGHDYLDGMVAGSLYGVRKAVGEFAAQHGYTVTVSREPIFASWFVVVK